MASNEKSKMKKEINISNYGWDHIIKENYNSERWMEILVNMHLEWNIDQNKCISNEPYTTILLRQI